MAAWLAVKKVELKVDCLVVTMVDWKDGWKAVYLVWRLVMLEVSLLAERKDC